MQRAARCLRPPPSPHSLRGRWQTTGAGGRLRYGMTTADVTPTDDRYVTGVVEPESQPSSRPASRSGSSHGPDGSFVAAPPAGRPSRGSVRRKTPDGRKTPDNSESKRKGVKGDGIFSYFPGDETAHLQDDEQEAPVSSSIRVPSNNGGDGAGEKEEGGGQQRREDGWRPSMVTDTLGPKIVQGAHELTDMMTRQLDHWQQLHTLLQASLSERNQLMQTVARQEVQLEKLARERQQDAARHSQHVKDIYARMQREQQVPLLPCAPASLALPCAHGAASAGGVDGESDGGVGGAGSAGGGGQGGRVRQEQGAAPAAAGGGAQARGRCGRSR